MAAKKPRKRRPSTRVSRKRERSRQEILDAARALLREGGLEAVTLASVAAQLDLTKQALYHYFPSKEALLRHLVVTLLDEEVETLVEAVGREASDARVLGALIRAFHAHYVARLDALRAVYCQSQLYPAPSAVIDADVLRDEINPRTRNLFDILETRLAGSSASKAERARKRRLAYTAWLAALGLLTMLGVADATRDPLVHEDEDLLDTLTRVFDSASGA